MALSNLDKNNLTRLFEMINVKDGNSLSYNNLTNLRSNYSTYSKLELIAKQIEFLKLEAQNILQNHDLNNDLSCLKYNFRKVPGTYYYVYENADNEKLLSLIGPDEWSNYNKFITKVYYDYDYQFYKLD
tara:strand:+ start:4204 stop:4590 length:387 start_codon:yes stop_codon:yes gene_type:complete